MATDNSTYHETENIISKVTLPDGKTYDIHDPKAIHDVSELGLSSALVFKGNLPNYDSLPTTGNKVGDVWLLTDSGKEYVYLDDGSWEALGFTTNAASTTHTHTVTGTAAAQTWTQKSGSAVVPTVSVTNGYIYAETMNSTDTIYTADSVEVLGSGSTFEVSGGTVTNKHLSASVDTNVAVGANGTAKAITGFGTHSTASAITGLNTTSINNPTVEDVTIPTYNVTDKTASKVTVTAGTAPSWTAGVTNGVLSFVFSAGTTPSVVSATDVATSKVSSGTAKTASKVTTDAVTVATGAKSTASAITDLGTPTTANALTGVKVTTQPTVKLVESDASGDVAVASGIEGMTITPNYETISVAKAGARVTTPTIKLATSSTPVGMEELNAAIPLVVSVGTGTGAVTVTGTNSTSNVTGTTGTPNG